MQQYLNALDTIKENIISLYAKKTGRDKEEVTGWMDATSWWTGQEAKDNGFVDELVEDVETPVVENRDGVLFVNSVNMHLPFDKAPTFMQNSLAAPTAAGRFVNKPGAMKPGVQHEEVQNMEIKTADDLRQAYPALVDQIEQAADIDTVFFNGNEHADRHIIDGKDVLVVIVEGGTREHNSHWEAGAKQNFDTGLYKAHTILYIRTEDYGPKPKVGKPLVMDAGTDHKRTFDIMKCEEECGVFRMTLQRTRQ